MSISLNAITKRFGSDTVLDDVTDDIPEGSLTALLGPSGSGKSTLLRVIAGLERPDSGRVVLHGRDVTLLPARDRRIGFCFQDYAPFFQMTVFDNVAYGLRVRRLARADIARRVDDLLGLVRLEAFATRYPRQLSGGQRQRMALARALAIEPAVLLLDEPFAALDAQVSAELREWVSTLQQRVGVTTILVTHNQSEAMEMGDRLVILNQGRVEQVGSPADVYDKPATDFVRGFLGPVTRFDGEAVRPHDLELCDSGEGTVAVVESVVRLGFEVRVTVRCPDGSSVWLQLSHDEAERRHPEVGEGVSVRQRR